MHTMSDKNPSHDRGSIYDCGSACTHTLEQASSGCDTVSHLMQISLFWDTCSKDVCGIQKHSMQGREKGEGGAGCGVCQPQAQVWVGGWGRVAGSVKWHLCCRACGPQVKSRLAGDSTCLRPTLASFLVGPSSLPNLRVLCPTKGPETCSIALAFCVPLRPQIPYDPACKKNSFESNCSITHVHTYRAQHV